MHIGLKIIGVMMRTTMLIATTLMEELAATMTVLDGTTIVLNANVFNKMSFNTSTWEYANLYCCCNLTETKNNGCTKSFLDKSSVDEV